MHSLALASPSLPPRLAYTQAAQLQVAQQLAAQQAAVQAAAGGPPTTRSESALIRGLSSYGTFSGTTPAPSTAEKSEENGGRRNFARSVNTFMSYLIKSRTCVCYVSNKKLTKYLNAGRVRVRVRLLKVTSLLKVTLS